jgi:hypothetical protein
MLFCGKVHNMNREDDGGRGRTREDDEGRGRMKMSRLLFFVSKNDNLHIFMDGLSLNNRLKPPKTTP